VAELIEHADFLNQPQWRIERQQVDERPQPHAPCRAGDRGEIDAGHRHHVERRGVMLGDMQAIDAGFVGGGGKGEPLVEERRERAVRPLHMIEQPDLHASSPST
jgi:hypothetical protein